MNRILDIDLKPFIHLHPLFWLRRGAGFARYCWAGLYIQLLPGDLQWRSWAYILQLVCAGALFDAFAA